MEKPVYLVGNQMEQVFLLKMFRKIWNTFYRNKKSITICFFALFSYFLIKYAIGSVGTEVEQSFPLEDFQCCEMGHTHLVQLVCTVPFGGKFSPVFSGKRSWF